MAEIFGEITSLRSSERQALSKLFGRRVGADELISLDLSRRVSTIVDRLGIQVALLIGRDGAVDHVCVGTKDRTYLPDLGRYRLDRARLRRLRLVLFVPDGERYLERTFVSPPVFGFAAGDRSKNKTKWRSELELPRIPFDIITDLEKLRLDAVAVIAVVDGEPNAVSVANLVPAEIIPGKNTASSVAVFGARDISELDLNFSEFLEELEASFERGTEKSYKTEKDGAVLIGAYTGNAQQSQASMDELAELARTAGVQVLDKVIQRRRSLDPRTVIGKGKVEEIVLHCLDLGAELLIFDRELSPAQLRSISDLTELKVLDRSMLILDIFAQRAKSSEGRVQVELAQLRYSLPRLTDRDTGLSRLTGGIGGRGPGETKLEIGRRRARDRITDLERKIDTLADQRALRRSKRQSRGVPVVAIVGYTNAGKSTLLNALTKGSVFVENKLFATLDPSSRRMRFPNEKEVIFVDTVGFIRELPKELVAAFRATLEEVGEADVLVHVVDAADLAMQEQLEVVVNTLTELGFGDKPRILVLNKVDKVSTMEREAFVSATGGLPISAVTRDGLASLIALVQEQLLLTFKGQDPGRFTELAGN